MALQMYQPTGYLPLDVPRLERADVKENALQLQSIEGSLDKLSQFAFKKVGEQAEREGLQYGAENAPTAEQVLAAQQEGKSIQELFAKPGTIFGDAARKVQAAQLRNELEVKGRNKLSELSAAVDSGAFNLAEVQKEITALTNGYAKSLAGVSPEESLRFRASMGTAGNAVYNKAADRSAKIYQEGIKFNAEEMLSQIPVILMDSIAAEQDPVLLGERFKVEASRVYDIAKQTGDNQFVKEKMDDFNRAKMGAIIDYSVSPAFAKNPAEGMRKILAGDFGKLDRVMQTVDRNKLVKMYMDRNGEIASAWKNTNDLNAAVNADKMNEAQDMFYAGKISGTQLLSTARTLGITLPDEQRKSLISGEGAGANQELYGNLESLADRQVVGENYFNDLASNKVITWKQANQLKKQVRNDNPEMSRARQLIDFTLGINDPMSPGMGDSKKVAAEAKAELINKQQAARAAGEQFSPYDIANELIKTEKVQQAVKSNDSKKERLRKKFEASGKTYDPDRVYTEGDLKEIGIRPSDIQSIMNIQKGK
jgi:hypothetical protein